MRALRKAFTMLELVFVIVVMGIIGVIGANIFRSTYDAYVSSSVNNRLQADTELALLQIANRLQYRFKDSVIARNGGGFVGLSSAVAGNYQVIEWVGYDIDGWQGVWDGAAYNAPTWSGLIDLDSPSSSAAQLHSPGTDTGDIATVIADVRPNGSATTIADAAIFFTGANTNVQTGYGWQGAAIAAQNGPAAHRINLTGAADDLFISSAGVDFAGTNVFEQYKLAWTAYALQLNNNGDLILRYDYQPWEADSYANAPQSLLMENVQTFQVQAIGDIIKVQLCVDNNASGNVPANQIYSLCKEKVIF